MVQCNIIYHLLKDYTLIHEKISEFFKTAMTMLSIVLEPHSGEAIFLLPNEEPQAARRFFFFGAIFDPRIKMIFASTNTMETITSSA